MTLTMPLLKLFLVVIILTFFVIEHKSQSFNKTKKLVIDTLAFSHMLLNYFNFSEGPRL